ncbi:MAG: TolC family protein [Acidovorax sp.]|nr:TolC family protein [Acidovorax sp.]
MNTYSFLACLPPMVGRASLWLGSGLVLTGCASFNAQPLTEDELRSQVQADRQQLAQDVVPLPATVTLEEAIARAIKYNAVQRLRAMEEAVAHNSFEASKFDMLPKLVASAGYRDRNKDLITRSEDSVTGRPSLAHPYISTEKESTLYSLGFSWSLLDFGQSYYAARQNADRALIAEERRRKALHNLVQDVRTAYWRVAAHQALQASMRGATESADLALADVRKVEAEKLRSPLEPLRYQRQLLENLRLLETIEQELSPARIELASLMGLAPGQAGGAWKVVDPAPGAHQSWLQRPVEEMEALALQRNPDLRESQYGARIARDETKRVLLRMFPGLSFNYALNHSTDSYLINDSWREAGVQISFNLLGLLSVPAQNRLAKAGVALADQKRMATQMAVLSQLHIARLQFANAAHQYERADVIAEVDQRLSQHVDNQVKVEKQTRQDSVAQQTASILSTLRRYQALATLQSAGSRLQATLGLEPVIEGSDTLPLPELTSAVGQALQRWEAGQLQ